MDLFNQIISRSNEMTPQQQYEALCELFRRLRHDMPTSAEQMISNIKQQQIWFELEKQFGPC